MAELLVLKIPVASSNRAQLRGLLLIGLVLAGYLAVLLFTSRMTAEVSVWIRLTVPNVWLLVTGIVLVRKWFPELSLTRGGQHAPTLVVLSAAAAVLPVCVAVLGPSRPVSEDLPVVVRALLIVFLVPAAEEVYFRGVLLGHLRRTIGMIPSVILVSVLFGLLHLPQGLHWTMAALSLLLCLATLLSGSLLWAVTLHLGWNGASLVWQLPLGPWRWVVTGLTASVIVLAIARGIGTRRRRIDHAAR